MSREDRREESSSDLHSCQSHLPFDLPVCVCEGLGQEAGLVVFPGYFYKDVCPLLYFVGKLIRIYVPQLKCN